MEPNETYSGDSNLPQSGDLIVSEPAMRFSFTTQIIKIASVAVAAAFAFALSAPVLAQNATQRPNIVFILADDLGYRELGCFGQQLIRTPNLDALAKQGMRLTQHYCGNAVCAPSRCVLMTGKHPGHAFVRDNASTPPEGQWPIPDSEVTIAELLQKQGYVTGAFGKWGLGGPESTGRPLVQGFNRFFGFNCQGHAHSYYPSYLWNDDKHIELNNKPPIPGHASLAKDADPADPRSYDVFKGQDYAPDRINEQALAFVRANKDKPFFLYYPTIIPHVALHVPDEELKPYLALGWKDPPFTRGTGYGYTPHFTPRAAYAAMISLMDRHIGELLKLLDELKLADNTIVIFSSDNGTTHLDEEVDYKFFNSVGELRGLKGSLYEGGVRVPTIVRYPGRVTAGSSSDRVSGFEDWMPTLLEIAGAGNAVPTNIDGISLAPTLLGKQQEPRPLLYREFPGYGGQQTIRVGDWKAVRQNMRKGNLDIELYNIADDIGEQRDVAAQHPDVVDRLAKLMAQEHTRSEKFPLKPID
jgi:arylsulfatase A-like enzyme